MENDDSSVIYKLIDENLLIDLVKCRPVLWDLSEGNYRKKTSCDQAWEEVYKDLFPNYHCFEGERKIALTKEVKRKWTNLRDAYNKTRKAGKESISKYKVLDFLAKVYDEKEKKGSVLISPVKEKNSPLDDSDADTQLNTTLQKRERAPASSFLQQNCIKHAVNVKSMSSRNISEENDTRLILIDRAPAQQGANLQPIDCESNKADSVVEDDIALCDSLISNADNEDMRVVDETPQCTTTFIQKNSAKCRVCSVPRSGVKRRLDQTEGGKGKFYYFLQFLKNEYASKEKFDSSRSKRLKTEILHLMDSVSSDFDDDQTEEFNFKAIKFLLAMKSWTEDEEKVGVWEIRESCHL